MHATAAGLDGFREGWASPDPSGADGRNGEWAAWGGREARYALAWSLYTNEAYSGGVLGGRSYRERHALYRHVRCLYNPAYRLGEFWAGRLMGGRLDPDAGDGESDQSALPIDTDNAAIRPGIARLWADSEFGRHKSLYCRFGAVLGDVGLVVDDDEDEGKVRLRVVHPGSIRWVRRDKCGAVEAYVIEEYRPDPDLPVDPQGYATGPDRTALYREEAFLDGASVVYRTYRNGSPFDWSMRGGEGIWDRPYPFVPMVLAQHESIGLPWGLSCYHAGLSRFREVDDQASGLSDQIRKAIRAPKLIAGADKADMKLGDDPDKIALVYLGRASGPVSVHDLTFNVDIAGVLAHIRSLIEDIEANYPELLADAGGMAGTPTAEAIRRSRQQAEAKVDSTRPGYDVPLACIQSMALAIAGEARYEGYPRLGFAAYAAGKLAHSIGPRPVFEVDEQDEMQSEGLSLANFNAAITGGIPWEVAARKYLGYSTADINQIKKLKEEEANQAAALVGTQGDIPEPSTALQVAEEVQGKLPIPSTGVGA